MAGIVVHEPEGESWVDQSISIPPTGEEAQISLDSIAGGSSITSGSGTTAAVAENKNHGNNRLILRHGSSLRLIATVCSFLADRSHSDNFSYIDPNGDQGKWKRKGMDLYYCAVMDPTTTIILLPRRASSAMLASMVPAPTMSVVTAHRACTMTTGQVPPHASPVC